jgi:starch phosphorylase
LDKVKKLYANFRAYMDVEPDKNRPSVAYLCMEYGLSHVLKIYSGGLCILAGDYIKEASDSNVDMCAVGFLYRYGYFTQALSMDGQQVAKYEAQNFGNLPIERECDADGNPIVVDVPYNNYTVHAYVWRVNVGRVKLYLLDTDNEMNSEFDRSITHSLYGGDWENRIKQEVLLGIGGVLTLQKLGIEKEIYHCNEGHAALCNVQRLVDYVKSGMTFNEALEVVRTSSLYTVHTPVPAGHDYFDEGLFGKYMGNYPQQLGITWDEFIGMGRINPEDKGERFCMSTFACNTSSWVNGVSWLHGKVSKDMFSGIWKGYFPEELDNVGYVTNGVHFPTWSATEWKTLYGKHFDKSYYTDQSNAKLWESIYNVADEEIWKTRLELKNKLITYIKNAFREDWLKNQGDPSRIVSILDKINPNALLIGFARRFATYKRAHLLFSDLDRLSKIVNNPERPVQFLFAGKAHPHDGAGQGLIKKIYEISRRPEFLGKIIFLENYDMKLARRLVTGVDIWMNTPTRPLEASGTSGEKALMNGVVNLSVLDGWWLEGYREGAGWAPTEKRTYQNQEQQDQLDAATIYSLLENEILPLYYAHNEKGYSEGWIRTVKNSIAQVAPHYTMKRQLDDYYDRYYSKLADRRKVLFADNYKKAKDIALWKEQVAERWDKINVVSIAKEQDMLNGSVQSGKKYKVSYVVDEQGLDDAVGLEIVTLRVDDEGKQHVYSVEPLDVVKREGNLFTFEGTHCIPTSGSFKVACRMYPKNADLPHRQDFCYVKWFN